MIDADTADSHATVDALAAVAESAGPGAMLRAARESQGLHIAALAVTLKVPVKKLEALESDRFDLLPDTVFTRALAMSVCRTLKMDATPVMAVLPQFQIRQIKTAELGLNASFKSTDGGAKGGWIKQFLNPARLVMVLLLVAIAIIFFWPGKPTGVDAGLVKLNPDSGRDQLGTGSQILSPAMSSTSVVHEPTLLSGPTVREPVRQSASSPALTGSGVISSSAVVSSPSATEAQQPPSVLALDVRGESWVEVTDAQGAAQLRRLALEGETLRVSGALPLSIVLGRADAVSVSVRGKPFDLSAISKDNVARFEVR